jgi:hypothetical protein
MNWRSESNFIKRSPFLEWLSFLSRFSISSFPLFECAWIEEKGHHSYHQQLSAPLYFGFALSGSMMHAINMKWHPRAKKQNLSFDYISRKRISMNNEEYLKQKNVPLQTTTYSELLEVLEGYGENHWWVSENPRMRAYYQTLDESHSLILPYRQYVADLTILLGRDVHLSEIRMSNKAMLRQEVEQAWKVGELV